MIFEVEVCVNSSSESFSPSPDKPENLIITILLPVLKKVGVTPDATVALPKVFRIVNVDTNEMLLSAVVDITFKSKSATLAEKGTPFAIL